MTSDHILGQGFFVSPLVSAKVTPLGKALATYVTGVRFLSGVNALVNLEMADTIKAFPTERTDEPFLLNAVTTCQGFLDLWVV